jgi:hypothetical protein
MKKNENRCIANNKSNTRKLGHFNVVNVLQRLLGELLVILKIILNEDKKANKSEYLLDTLKDFLQSRPGFGEV